MVAFIFGIIIIIAGIIGGIVCILYHYETGYSRDERKIVYPAKKWAWISFTCGAILGVLLLISSCMTSVSTGHTGIVTVFGRVEDYTFEAGVHAKAPWVNVTEMDNRVQKATVELSCFSSDIQEVNMKYTLNYQIDKQNAQEIYRTIGTDYYITVIEPTIAEAVKVVTARYTAEQLVQTRPELAASIEELLTDNLKPYNIKVASTAIEDMDFTDTFTNAVEAKQVAEQKKKQAVIEQEQALLEAENEKQIAQKKAEADAAVAKTRAEADKEVAQIGADSAEYQGKKEAAIALQRLASINGWTVVSDAQTGINKLYKVDGTEVTVDELKEGSQRLIDYYYIQQWNGILPEYYVGSDNVSTIVGLRETN